MARGRLAQRSRAPKHEPNPHGTKLGAFDKPRGRRAWKRELLGVIYLFSNGRERELNCRLPVSFSPLRVCSFLAPGIGHARPRVSSLLHSTRGFPGCKAHCNFLVASTPGSSSCQPTWKRNTTTHHIRKHNTRPSLNCKRTARRHPGSRSWSPWDGALGNGHLPPRNTAARAALGPDGPGLGARRLPLKDHNEKTKGRRRGPLAWALLACCWLAAMLLMGLPQGRTLTLSCPRPTLTDPDCSTLP